MIESLKILSQDTQAASDGDNKNKALTLVVDNFKNQMTTQGKENGENLLDHYVEEIITDSKLVHEDSIIIDDFAKYLMSKWLINYGSVKSHADNFFNLLFYSFLEFRFKKNTSVQTSLNFHPKNVKLLVCY